MYTVTVDEFQRLACNLRERIFNDRSGNRPMAKVWGVPTGGLAVAAAVADQRIAVMAASAEEADVFVDDLIDSGATMERFAEQYPGKPFYALIDKREPEWAGKWIIWPWEGTAERGIEDHIVRLLEFVGEDATRGGLAETPARVAKAWQHWCSGYGKDPAEVLKVFEDGAEKYDEMVVVRDIPFYSKCEHHLADIFGTATIAYVPNGKIVGLSKLNRVLDLYARRLQVQERLTAQVADALMEHLQPKGAGVVIKARHMCMESRGVCQQGHHTVTSALRGVFKEQSVTRAEFLALAR